MVALIPPHAPWDVEGEPEPTTYMKRTVEAAAGIRLPRLRAGVWRATSKGTWKRCESGGKTAASYLTRVPCAVQLEEWTARSETVGEGVERRGRGAVFWVGHGIGATIRAAVEAAMVDLDVAREANAYAVKVYGPTIHQAACHAALKEYDDIRPGRHEITTFWVQSGPLSPGDRVAWGRDDEHVRPARAGEPPLGMVISTRARLTCSGVAGTGDVVHVGMFG